MPAVREKVEAAVIAGLLALPEPVQRVLAGRPVELDGQRLSTEIQLMFRIQRLARVPAAETLPWAEARAELAHQSRLTGGRQSIGSVRDLTVDGAEGPLAARLYTPTSRLAQSSVPTMLFFHGGGMVYGADHTTHEQACRFLAERSGVQVLSVDYRLAPEAPYPAGVDDAEAAYRWLVDNAASVDADPDRLAVGGDSAGGYLAAVTALYAAEQGLPCTLQLLVYPVTDFVEKSMSRHRFAEGFFLTNRFMDQATEAYFPGGAGIADPRASVLRRESFPDGLAPAYVATAGFDPLRDEGEAYARVLGEHGVTVEQTRFPGLIHGFFNIVGVGRDARAANAEIADRVRALL